MSDDKERLSGTAIKRVAVETKNRRDRETVKAVEGQCQTTWAPPVHIHLGRRCDPGRARGWAGNPSKNSHDDWWANARSNFKLDATNLSAPDLTRHDHVTSPKLQFLSAAY